MDEQEARAKAAMLYRAFAPLGIKSLSPAQEEDVIRLVALAIQWERTSHETLLRALEDLIEQG